MLIWQKEYKENISISNEILNKSTLSLENSSRAFEIIVKNSENFENISHNL
jgi:hypothetical protein